MKNKRNTGYPINHLLRQFYQIRQIDISPQKKQHTLPTALSGLAEGYDEDEDEEQQEQDKQHWMKTTSTEIMDSKLRVWEESTLRQIQEKSEGEENSNYSNSLEKYSFTEEQISHIKPIQNRYTIKQLPKQHNKHQNPNPKHPKPKNPKPKLKPKSKHPIDDQLKVPLKYDQSSSMKMLNKAWFKVLDDIHRK